MTDASAGSTAATAIGTRLREARSRRGLSLRQLARSTELSPSLLSQVENGKVTPSVDTLAVLAQALEVPVAAFFGGPLPEERAPGDVWVVRGDARQRIALDYGVTWENLLPQDVPGMRFMEVSYAPGAHTGAAFLRHPGRDVFLVLTGELVFRVGFSEHRLAPGDSISFTDFEPHQVRNPGDVEARAIVCIVGDDVRGR